MKGVYGILTSENDDSKKLDKALEREVYRITDYTGAMHQAVVGHLMGIWKTGYQTWLDRARKQKSSGSNESRVYIISDKARSSLINFPAHKEKK